MMLLTHLMTLDCVGFTKLSSAGVLSDASTLTGEKKKCHFPLSDELLAANFHLKSTV